MKHNKLENKEAIIELTSEVYEDLGKPIVKEIGGVFGTIFGLINNVLLYKPKQWIIKYKTKLEQYAQEQKKQLDEIPIKNKIEPPLNVLVPTIEGISMNLDNEEISSLFTRLLTSSCDMNKINSVHPSFVEIIKQLSSIDAKIFKLFCNKYLYGHRLPTITPNGRFHDGQIIMGYFPEWITELESNEFTLYDISKSLTQLNKLGLIRNMNERFSIESEKLSQNCELQKMLNYYNDTIGKPNKSEMKLDYEMSSFKITEYGQQFAKCCLNINFIPSDIYSNLSKISVKITN